MTPSQIKAASLNRRIAEFAAELIKQGRNPILAVFDAMQVLSPTKRKTKRIVHSVDHSEPKK